MASVRPAILSATFALIAHAADLPNRPLEFTAIAEAADSTPPEFRADALLRLVESGKIADLAWKRDLIGQAFASAAAAQAANPLHAIPPAAPAVGPALDRVSLQARAVDAMQAIDGRKARELFLQIVKPAPRRLECSDTAWDDLAAYYGNASRLVATFSVSERRDGDHVNFAVGIISRITSVVELPAAEKLLTVPGWRPDEKELLGAKFAGVAETITADDRSFTAVGADARRSLDGLARSGYDAELFRGVSAHMLERQQSVEHCRSNSTASGGLRTAGSVPGLEAQSVPQASLDASSVNQRWMRLMYGPKQQGLTENDKNSSAWRDELAAYLGAVDDMKAASPEDELGVYRMKTEALGGLLLAVPSSADRERIRARCIATVAASPLQERNRVRWFAPASQLVDSTRSLFPVELAKLLDAFESSGNPVLILYAKLERTIPRPPSFGPNTR